MGKDISTDDMAPGPYRLVIKATDPATHETSYQSLNFSIVDRISLPQRWTLLTSPKMIAPSSAAAPNVVTVTTAP